MDIMKTIGIPTEIVIIPGIPIICDVREIGIIVLTLVRIKCIQEVKDVVK